MTYARNNHVVLHSPAAQLLNSQLPAPTDEFGLGLKLYVYWLIRQLLFRVNNGLCALRLSIFSEIRIRLSLRTRVLRWIKLAVVV